MGMIERGGMAEVYQARKPTDTRMYAIMHAPPARQGGAVCRHVRARGRLAVRFEHVNIVRTFELGRTDGRYFISMEYIGGKDPRRSRAAARSRAGESGAARLLHRRQDARRAPLRPHAFVDSDGKALAIVNRDVSPSNVRIGYDGEVKLLDFGIAQAMVQFTKRDRHPQGQVQLHVAGADPRHAGGRPHRHLLHRHHPPRDAHHGEAVPRRHRVPAHGAGAQRRGLTAEQV